MILRTKRDFISSSIILLLFVFMIIPLFKININYLSHLAIIELQ